MIKFYKTITEKKEISEIAAAETNCWIHLENPTQDEICKIEEITKIPKAYLECAMDEEETARTESEDGLTLTIFDAPVKDSDNKNKLTTVPLAIIYNSSYFVTVCTKKISSVTNFFDGKVKYVETEKHQTLHFQILYSVLGRFLVYLKHIDKTGNEIQENINKSVANQELIELLELQKSLVIFSASLSNNQAVVQKLMLTVGTNKKDKAKLEEVAIENRQAIEMCTIYREILKNTMDAFSSIVNNNMNFAMKFLTVITIILSIPMVIAGFWGMNTEVPWESKIYGFYIAIGISILLSVAAIIYLNKRKMM